MIVLVCTCADFIFPPISVWLNAGYRHHSRGVLANLALQTICRLHSKGGMRINSLGFASRCLDLSDMWNLSLFFYFFFLVYILYIHTYLFISYLNYRPMNLFSHPGPSTFLHATGAYVVLTRHAFSVHLDRRPACLMKPNRRRRASYSDPFELLIQINGGRSRCNEEGPLAFGLHR